MSDVEITAEEQRRQAQLALAKAQEERRAFLGKTHPRTLLWKLSYPSALAFFFNALYILADSLFLTQDSPIQAAAASYSLSIAIYAPQALSLLCGLGSNGAISKRIGQQKFEEAEDAVAACFQLCVILGIIYPVIFLPSLPRLLPLLGCPPGLIHYAKRYCYIVIGSCMLMNFNVGFSNVLRCQGYAKYSGLCMIVGTLANLCVGPALIYGAKKGIEGSAISVFVGNFVSSVMALAKVANKGRNGAAVPLFWRKTLRYQPVVLEILSGGVGGFFINVSNAVSISCFNNLMTKTSKTYLQAEAVAATLGNSSTLIYLFFSACIGINTAFIPSASFAKGAGLTRRFAALFKYTITWQSIIMVFGAIVLTAFCKWWPYIFYSHNTITDVYFRAQMKRVLYTLSPTRSIVAITILGFAVFQAAQMFSISAFMALLRQLLVLVPLAYIIAYTKNDIYDLLTALPGSDMIATSIAWIIIFINRKKLHLVKSAQSGPLCMGDEEESVEVEVTAESDDADDGLLESTNGVVKV